MDNFLIVSMKLINETKKYEKEYIESGQWNSVLKLEKLEIIDRKKFVKEFKKITGAKDFDLPDVIFAER